CPTLAFWLRYLSRLRQRRACSSRRSATECLTWQSMHRPFLVCELATCLPHSRHSSTRLLTLPHLLGKLTPREAGGLMGTRYPQPPRYTIPLNARVESRTPSPASRPPPTRLHNRTGRGPCRRARPWRARSAARRRGRSRRPRG